MHRNQTNLHTQLLIISIAISCWIVFAGCTLQDIADRPNNITEAAPQASEAASDVVYMMAVTGFYSSTKQIQVWQISVGDWQFSKHYALTRTLHSPIELEVPAGETASRIFELVPTQTPVEQIFNKHWLLEGALAVKGNKLSTIESSQHCVERSPICFGLHRLYLFDAETGTERVLTDVPSHFASFEHDGYESTRGIGNLSLSPNGQYVAAIISTSDGFITREVLVIDVNRQELINLLDAPNVFDIIGWAPDSSTVTLNLRSREGLTGFRNCSLPSGQCQDVELDELWIHGNADWHPDEQHVIFAASETNPRMESCYDRHLYLGELHTERADIHPISTALSISHPRWSPDGKYIAANKRDIATPVTCYTRPSVHTNVIVIVEVFTGKIIQEITGDEEQFIRNGLRPVEWIWGDYRTLLLHSAEGVQIVDVLSDTVEIVPYPQEMTGAKRWHTVLSPGLR